MRFFAVIVVTPLRREEWEKELSRFPDREFVKFLLDCMAYGFRIGYKREVAPLVSAKRNMLSAEANPAVVEDYLAKEVMLGIEWWPCPPRRRFTLAGSE